MTIDNAAPVIAGVDGSPAGYRAAVWAAGEAQSSERPLLLLAVNAWPPYLGTPWGGVGWDIEGGRAVAGEVLEQARRGACDSAPGVQLQTEVVDGIPARILVERSRGACLLVVGRRGGGEFSRLSVGSTAAQAVTHADCTVVVVPEVPPVPTVGGPGVVVGVDIGEHSQGAIRFGFDQASRLGQPLTALRAWTLLTDEPAIRNFAPNPEELEAEQRRLLSEALAGWCAKYPDVPVRRWLVRRHAARALVEASQGASLLVVGARGAGGFDGLRLGSVGDGVIRHSCCAVAVAR